MPISYHIDPALGVAFKRVTGRLTPEELLAHLHDFTADSAFRPGLHAFVDCRETDVGSSSDDVRRMASDVRANGRELGTGRCAILVASDVQFGMVRVFEAFVGDTSMEFRTFRAVDEARQWLEQVTGTALPIE